MFYERSVPGIQSSEPLPPQGFNTYESWLEEERQRLYNHNEQLAALNRELNVRVDALSDIITESVARDQKGFTLWILSKYLASFFR